MTETTADETTDDGRIDYEYRAEAPAVPRVGTAARDPGVDRITGTPELAETATRPAPTRDGASPDGHRREERR
ncbi:MAG: hypothetical protein ABEH47_07900 [Haloferacaceae archaeon]